MTRKTYDILYTVTEYSLKGDDFGICSNIRVQGLIPGKLILYVRRYMDFLPLSH